MLDVLRARFDPSRAGDLDATVEFNWGDGACRVGIHDAAARFYEEETCAPTPDLIIYFRDAEQARAIVEGKADPVAAFMAGEFRSSGYLVWVFQTLAAFSKR